MAHQPTASPDNPSVFTVHQFCERNGISASTVYREIKAGRLRVIKIGARTVIRAAAEADWLNWHEQHAVAGDHVAEPAHAA